MPREFPSTYALRKRIGIPIDQWTGRCTEIANAILKSGAIKGTLEYGLYHGPIADGTYFSGRRSTHHAWIRLTDGRICDPTRWVFESADPDDAYLYVGPDSDDYDFGGNDLREDMQTDCPVYSELYGFIK